MSAARSTSLPVSAETLHVHRAKRLQVVGAKTRVFRDAAEHARPDLLAIGEREDHIGPARPREYSVRPGLAFDGPTDAEERGKHPRGPRTGPLRHAAANEMVARSGPASPCSRRSASTRRAKACAFARASSAVRPSARTPGSSVISAI